MLLSFLGNLITNFRLLQILWADHCSLVAAFTRDLIDDLDHLQDEDETEIIEPGMSLTL